MGMRIERAKQFNRLPLRLPRDVFSPKLSTADFFKKIGAQELFADGQASPVTELIQAVAGQKKTGITPAQFIDFFEPGKRGAKLVEQADQFVYSRLAQRFDLESPEAGMHLWEDHQKYAKAVIERLIGGVGQKNFARFNFLDEASRPRTPGKIMALLLSDVIDPRLRFELQRQVGLTLISMELEFGNRELEDRAKRIEDLLDKGLYDHGTPIGGGRNIDVESVHGFWTNAVRWVKGAEGAQTRRPIFGRLKIREAQRLRYATGDPLKGIPGIGLVSTNPRTKDHVSSIIKAVADLRNPDTIEPGNVRDRVGSLVIVEGEFFSDGKRVNDFVLRFKDILTEGFRREHGYDFNLADDPNSFKEDNVSDNGERPGFRRVLVNFPDLDYPYELIVRGVGSQMDADGSVKHLRRTMREIERDLDRKMPSVDGKSKSQKNDPLAHSIYTILRKERPAFQTLFPPVEGLYEPYNINNLVRPRVRVEARRLRHEYSAPRFDFGRRSRGQKQASQTRAL